MKEEVYIIDSVRLPNGKFLGQYKQKEASELGAITVEFLLQKNNINPKSVDELVVGQVLTAGVGMNPARQTGLKAGITQSAPCYLVNQVCGSGLRAVIDGAKTILLQDAHLIVAGGQECMSRARHTILARAPKKLGDSKLVDSLFSDGLTDYFNECAMGKTAENVAKKYQITREEQDEFAYLSQQKTKIALEKGYLQKQLVSKEFLEKLEQGQNFCEEHPRSDLSKADLEVLKPVFEKNGTVTAGNSSGINDGAAFCMLASKQAVQKYHLTPLARITGWAHSGLDPQYMGVGPVSAVQKLLHHTKEKCEDFDLIESNEAFAATSIAVGKELGWDEEKVNVNGGAIALGHPIGASGARILTDLLYELKRTAKQKGIATMCIGGGMGIALAVELC
jgi:acetyl-CoA C-acetyltransferase